MPTMRLALVPDGSKRLEVAWQGRWKNLTLKLDGAPVLAVPTETELKAGRTVATPAGALAVQLKTPAFGRQLWLTIDGRPIPGTAADPAKRLAESYGVLYVVAALNVALGTLAALDLLPLAELGFGVVSIAAGAVFGLLGFAVHRYRSTVALAMAMALLALDSLAGIVASMHGGSSAPASGLVVRVLILVYVSRGFAAVREMRAAEPRADATAA
jgi:hypothetical protein